MIDIRLAIHNPFFGSLNKWHDLFQREWAVTKNKTFDLRFDYHLQHLFAFRLDTNWRGEDHAGPELDLVVLGLGMFIQLRDNRHWNYDHDRWLDYSNPKEIEEYNNPTITGD
jgi:hypothetical protein